eukprot:TRINITY_DN12793_c0_g3_i1.p1 TRINITY_DN12793_c0_g3~~TRINITY_DN12793_c0_g3_i1.p1  ORF type:complete len:315 (+),score=39.66 TRINITY_DN12793_c0_g3_i1:70-1014(+)
MAGRWRCLCCCSPNDAGLTANGDIAASVASERDAGAAAAGGASASTPGNESPAGRGGSLLDEESPYHVRVDGFQRARGRGRNRPIVYTMTVTHGNARWPIRRRFRQVAVLHDRLVQGLGRGAMRDGLPRPPPRVTFRSLVLGSQSREFLRVRSAELQAYLDRLLLYIPFVDQCEALREFLCTIDMTDMSYDRLLELEEALGNASTVTVGLDEKAIEALPSRPAQPPPPSRGAPGADAGVTSDDPGKCVICQEVLDPPWQQDLVGAKGEAGSVEQSDIRVLPCGHEYHFHCIARWLAQSNVCCVCQSPVAMPAPH